MKGAIKALKFLKKQNYYIFIVTNQAGIAKKIFTINDLFVLHKKLKILLSKKNINIDDVQFSPYHKKGKLKKFTKNSNLRKPNNGMILNIMKKFRINKKNSFFIGDKYSDYLAANKSNLQFEYVKKDLFHQVKNKIKLNEKKK